MKNVCLIIACGLVFAASVCNGQGIGHGVELRLTSQKLMEVAPGKIITGSFIISNRTTDDIEIMEILELPTIPEGWQPVIDYERSVVLGRGEETLRLITLLVPDDCPAGRYEVVYSLTDLGGARVLAREAFSIIVRPVVKLDAKIEEKPEIVMAGDEYHVKMRLENTGNSTASLRLTARTSPEYPVFIEPSAITLDPGKKSVVDFTVSTDAAVTSKVNHVLDIDAVAEVQGSEPAVVKRSLFMEILPTIAKAVDLRLRLPTEASFIMVGNRDESGFQMQYSGHGSLDEAGTRRVEFLFRGPDVREQSIYGMRDELRIAYCDRIFDVWAGDKFYELSPLSERLAFGRGGELRLTPGEFEVGSYYMESRWDVPGKKEVSLYAGYEILGALTLKGNYLHKQKAESISLSGYEADIYTLETKFTPTTAFSLGAEYGFSDNQDDSGSEDPAHRVTIDGNLFDRIWYTAENTYAGPRFLGYYNDVLFSNGTVSAGIYRNLRGSIAYRLYEFNLDLDPAKRTAPRERSLRGTLAYPFSTGTNISFDYETLTKQDDLSPTRYDFEEDILRIGFGQRIKNFNIQTYAERALFADNLQDGAERNLERYSIYAYYRPSPGQSVSFYTRIGHNSFYGSPERTISAGFSAALHLSKRLKCSLSYQGSNLADNDLPRQDYMITTLDILLPNHHSVSLKGRWYEFDDIGREDYSFIASYTVPFALPVLKKSSIGSLKGKVLDMETGGSIPGGRMLVAAGDHITATDPNGEFSFPGIEPGTYSLQIEQRTIGSNRITSEQLPVIVEVNGGETTYREIGITRTCSISGTVALFTTPDGDSAEGAGDLSQDRPFIMSGLEPRSGRLQKDDFVEAGGLAGILVEISDGREKIYRRTNKNGRFRFDGLRPGTWRIKVHDEGLPSFHFSEEDRYEIEIAAGEAHDMKIRILPLQRPIQFIDGGIMSSIQTHD